MNFSLASVNQLYSNTVEADRRTPPAASLGNLALDARELLPAIAEQRDRDLTGGCRVLQRLLEAIRAGAAETALIRRDDQDIERLFRTGCEIVTLWNDDEARMLAQARPRAVAEYPPEEQVIAREKASWVAEVDAYCRRAGVSQAEAVRVISSRPDLWPTLRAAARLNLRNYRLWRGQLGNLPNGRPDIGNLLALVRKYDRGPRRRPGDPDFWRVFLILYLNAAKRSIRDCWEYAARLYREYTPVHHADAIPSYKQVADWMRKYLPVALKNRLREGREYFVNHEQGYVMRDWSAVAVNEIWFGDHHQLDFWVRVWDPETRCWGAVRPWLTAWRDAKSGAFLGWRLIPRSPCHLDILAAMIFALAATGGRPPAWFYTDQGADYKKPGLFTDLDLGGGITISVGRCLGSQWKEARGYNGREKPVERDFKDVCEWFAKWAPGYCGNAFTNRPEDVEDTRKHHPERLWDMDTLRAHFAGFLTDVYHARRRPGSVITDGRPPAEIAAEIPASAVPLDPETLFLATLWPVRLAQVGRGNMIECAHPIIKRPVRRDRLYKSDALYTLKGKRPVILKASPWSDAAIFAFNSKDGRFLTAMTRPEQAAPIGADGDTLGRISHANNCLLKQVNLDFHAFTQGLPDQLAARARGLVQLPPAPGALEAPADADPAPRRPAELGLNLVAAPAAAVDAYLDQVNPEDLEKMESLILSRPAEGRDFPDGDDEDVAELEHVLSKGPDHEPEHPRSLYRSE